MASRPVARVVDAQQAARQSILTRQIQDAIVVRGEKLVGEGPQNQRQPDVVAEMAPPPDYQRMTGLLSVAAIRRLGRDEQFACTSYDARSNTLQDLLTMSSFSTRVAPLDIYEMALRMTMMLSGLVVKATVLVPEAVYTSALPDSLPQYSVYSSPSEYFTALALLGHCILTIFVTRPAVTGISDGAMGQYKDIAKGLSVRFTLPTSARMVELTELYAKRMDLTDYLKMIASADFSQDPAMIAYHRRYTAGCSHFIAISTALSYAKRCPIFSLVSDHEYRTYVDGLALLKLDPLFLNPLSKHNPAATNPYRATSLPALVNFALAILLAFGEYTWQNYSNVPFMATVRGVSMVECIEYIFFWVKATRSASVARLELGFAYYDGPSFGVVTQELMHKFEQSTNRAPVVAGAVISPSLVSQMLTPSIRMHNADNAATFTQAGAAGAYTRS